MILHLENINDFGKIINDNKKVIIDFYAAWCGPCKMLSPMLEKIAAAKPEWTILKIDIDHFAELASQFAVNAVPTLVFMVDQKVKETSLGFRPDSELMKIINKFE